MKYFPGHVIVVPLIIVFALLDTARPKQAATYSNTTHFSIPSPEPPLNTTSPGPVPATSSPEPKLHRSCKKLYQSNPALPSGYYTIKPRKKKKTVYCEMNTTNCGDTTGGWMRVAHIDANSVTHNCAKWKLNYIGVWRHCQPDPVNVCLPLPTPMCTRSHSDKHGCSSVTFPAHRVPYTKVCGRARGY